MRAAPPVACDVARRGFWAGALICVGAASAGALGLAVWPERMVPGLALMALGGLAAAWVWQRQPERSLVWTGARWMLAGRTGSVELVWDGGRWLLACWRDADPRGGRCWLPLSAADAGSRSTWHALRVALHHARPMATVPGAGKEGA